MMFAWFLHSKKGK